MLLAPPLLAQQEEHERPKLYQKSLEAAQQTLAGTGVYENQAELERVTEIGYRIAQETGFTEFPFTFHLIDMEIPNAFALPGGQLFVTRGMLDLGLSDDMLAALLGHEIAHVVRNHGSRMQRRATLLNTFGQALLVGAILGASGRNNRNSGVYSPYDPRYGGNSTDMIQATAATTTAVSELLLRKYSRTFEDEADEAGQRWAAAAGFDPNGTEALMELMAARMPESGGYGYWRTHPFMEDRAHIGAARAEGLVIQPAEGADLYRAQTQKVLLSYADEHPDLDPDSRALLETEALTTWPKGPLAEGLRLERLHQFREAALEERKLSQDLGRLIRLYREQQEEVARLTPDSPLQAKLETEIEEIRQRQQKIYPRAAEVFAGGVYETGFLEVFLSNYPDAPERPVALLQLGNAYSRLRRQTDAVGAYLKAWRAAPQSAAGKKAQAGLKNLAPTLEELGALQQLAEQDDDLALQELARDRLRERASTYDDLANGAEYLRRYPDGPVAGPVGKRLDSLAESVYAEMVLYRSVGDHVKALERAHRILTLAPLSPAADRLRDSLIEEG